MRSRSVGSSRGLTRQDQLVRAVVLISVNALEQTLPKPCDTLTKVPIDVLDRVLVMPACPLKAPSDSVSVNIAIPGPFERISPLRTN